MNNQGDVIISSNFTSRLDDQLGPEDWLIPSEEITSKRFIKQTATHNIYKADWFGDVLVYEPRNRSNESIEEKNDEFKKRQQQRRLRHLLNPIELTLKLDALKLTPNTNYNGQHLSPSICSLPSPKIGSLKKSRSQQSLINDESGFDSAYSSISTTPLYNTKTNNDSEFEFPIRANSNGAVSSNIEFSLNGFSDRQTNKAEPANNVDLIGPTETLNAPSNNLILTTKKQQTKQTKLVILNKQSYNFNSRLLNNDKFNQENYDHQEDDPSKIDLMQLNEMRLIAHEGFMLFMGASLDNMQTYANEKLLGRDQYINSALVIQMNHQRATPLHDLLHNFSASAVINFQQAISSSSSAATSFERFFQRCPLTNHTQGSTTTTPEIINNNNLQQTTILSLATKLAICQQVTNAMTYLHDKNIVHGRLSTTNIYIEPNQNVKISLIDEHEKLLLDSCDINTNCGTTKSFKPLNKIVSDLSSLTYLSPELIRTIEISNQIIDDDNIVQRCRLDVSKLGKMADIFAFGTILYELFEERFPFSKLVHTDGCLSPNKQLTFDQNWISMPSADELISLIGFGKIAQANLRSDESSKLPCRIAEIIAACWTTEIDSRPGFKQLIFV